MRLIIDIDDETYKNITFYGTYLCPRDKENLEQALKTAKIFEGLSEERWISCKERLPIKNVLVLTYIYKDCPAISFIGNDGRWSTDDFDIDKEDEPVAWMPLPRPYRGNENV